MKPTKEKITRATKLEWFRDASGAEMTPDEMKRLGICGRMTGIALVYGIADDYGTMFAPGCLTKTRAEKVNTGKVRLFADHLAYSETHVGVVRSIVDVGDAAVMTADLFDTEAGRAMKEYLEAVLKSGGETGLSVGFRSIDREWKEIDMGDGKSETMLVFKEISLGEISVTPVPAVPGADVTGVRRQPGETEEDLLRRALRHILRSLPEHEAKAEFDEVYATSAATPDTEAAPPAAAEAAPAEGTQDAAKAEATETHETAVASPEERRQAFRRSFSPASAPSPSAP